MNTQTVFTKEKLSLLERCELALNFDTADVKQLLKDLEDAIAAERSKEKLTPHNSVELHQIKQANPQQEPIGYVDLAQVKNAKSLKLTCVQMLFEKYDGDYSPVYAQPQPLKPLSDWSEVILTRTHNDAASDEYFKERPQIDFLSNRILFRTAFEIALEKQWRAIEAKLGVGK